MDIAVVGLERADRKTFVQKALGLERPCSRPNASGQFPLDGQRQQVKLVEVCLDEISFTAGHEVGWPENVAEHSFKGVVVLHNAVRADSIRRISELLGMREPQRRCQRSTKLPSCVCSAAQS